MAAILWTDFVVAKLNPHAVELIHQVGAQSLADSQDLMRGLIRLLKVLQAALGLSLACVRRSSMQHLKHMTSELNLTVDSSSCVI